MTADAELDRAVEATYAGAFWSAGQKCTATRRILVQEDVYESFRDALLAEIEAADRYEAGPIERIRVRLESGAEAFVYVAADP